MSSGWLHLDLNGMTLREIIQEVRKRLVVEFTELRQSERNKSVDKPYIEIRYYTTLFSELDKIEGKYEHSLDLTVDVRTFPPRLGHLMVLVTLIEIGMKVGRF